jgi:predicted glycoside hydrolase/deacetylase ChbG (UPF0249 family)
MIHYLQSLNLTRRVISMFGSINRPWSFDSQKGGDPSMDKFLIVNADDYGFSEGVSRGIIEGHLQGVITSTSVMVNMPFAGEAISKAKLQASDLGLGLHLNLTWGHPVLPIADVRSLVSEEGVFWDLLHLAVSPPESSHIQSEIFAQFDRFTELAGGNPDHLDSHQFVTNMLPTAFTAMLELAAKHDLPIRSPKPFLDEKVVRDMISVMTGDLFDEQAIATILRYVEANREVFSELRHTRWPEHFEYHFYNMGSNKENLVAILRNLPSATTEIMCHAGYGEDLANNEVYRELREKELEILTDPEINQLVKSERIALLKFSDI